MAKVWAVQENSHFDYTPAERFGRIHFVTYREFRMTPNSLVNRLIIEDIEAFIPNFDTMEDFLLMTGNPITMSYVFHRIMEVSGGRVQVLKWDNRQNTYQAMRFCAEDILNVNDRNVIGGRDE